MKALFGKGSSKPAASFVLLLLNCTLFSLVLSSYAPWCPACQQFSSTWENFGNTMENRVEEDRIGVGKVDVTEEPSKQGGNSPHPHSISYHGSNGYKKG